MMRQSQRFLLGKILFCILRRGWTWTPVKRTWRQAGWCSSASECRRRDFSRLLGANERVQDEPRKATQGNRKFDLNLVVIDHYDSFTYNLVDMLGQICINPPAVYAADSASEWQSFVQQQQLDDPRPIDGVILSPGPGHPKDDSCRLSRQAVQANPDMPILGVCLGHQILGTVYGASCVPAPQPVHGQVNTIWATEGHDDALSVESHTGAPSSDLWASLFGPTSDCRGKQEGMDRRRAVMNATRYHSLQVAWPNENSTALPIVPTAVVRSDDVDVVMALRHQQFPHFGVQFHPESIGSQPHGFELLRHFCQVCHAQKQQRRQQRRQRDKVLTALSSPVPLAAKAANDQRHKGCHVYIHKVPIRSKKLDPVEVMQCFVVEDRDNGHCFWLDSSGAARDNAVSLLGRCNQRRVEYWGPEKPVARQGLHIWARQARNKWGWAHHPGGDILAFLEQEQSRPKPEICLVSWCDGAAQPAVNGHSSMAKEHKLKVTELSPTEEARRLPFAFRGGYVGYLGYEVRHLTERYLAEQEHGEGGTASSDKSVHCAQWDQRQETIPSAAFGFADQSFVYCHASQEWFLVGVAAEKEDEDEMLEWIRHTSLQMSALSKGTTEQNDAEEVQHGRHLDGREAVSFIPRRSRDTYNRNFHACLEHIRKGESYELCLTNQLEANVETSSAPWNLYQILRQQNPAPFSAFFDWNSDAGCAGETGSALSLCCSSPERFLSVMPKQPPGTALEREFLVEAKPIKGTCARVLPLTSEDHEEIRLRDEERAKALRTSRKDRAENLMIVDLLRNDLSRVCETGSVHVPKLMEIESFATVHQMVSTIRGTFRTKENTTTQSRSTTVDVLKACFPGGSMTGAPKLRTMHLLNELEEGVPRGPYSGALGYVSVNGAMDFNKVIRTVVVTPADKQPGSSWNVNVGAGGAITALSQNEDEYQELMVKAAAVTRAVQVWSSSAMSMGRQDPDRTGRVSRAKIPEKAQTR